MKCGRVEEMLSRYVDNSLGESDKRRVEAHLAECQNCTSYLHTMTKVDELIKLKAKKEEPSKEYWDSYWRRLQGRLEKIPGQLNSSPSGSRNPFHPFIPRLALTLNGVLVALLILTGSFFYRNTQQMKSLRVALDEKRDEIAHPRTIVEVFLPAVSEQAIEKSVRKQVRLFQEISEMFPHTIKWVVTNDGEVDMGLASQGSLEKAVSQKQAPIFLQFEILCAGPVPEIVSSPQIMLLSGNEVNAKLRGLSETDGTIYQYHCFPVLRADGNVDLTARIFLDSCVLSTSTIVSEGERIKLGSLRKGNARYSVYVTIRSRGLNMAKTESRGV